VFGGVCWVAAVAIVPRVEYLVGRNVHPRIAFTFLLDFSFSVLS
jgi:hypothetical protein